MSPRSRFVSCVAPRILPPRYRGGNGDIPSLRCSLPSLLRLDSSLQSNVYVTRYNIKDSHSTHWCAHFRAVLAQAGSIKQEVSIFLQQESQRSDS